MSFIIIIMPLILPIYLVITNLKNIKTQPNEHAHIHKSQKNISKTGCFDVTICKIYRS